MSHTSSPSTPLPPSARPSAAEEDPDPWGTNSPSTSPKLPLSSGLGPRRLFADDDDAGFGSKPEGQKGSNVHDGVDEDGDGDGDDELPDWTKELSSGGGMRGLSSPTALNSGRNGGDPDGFERTGWTPDVRLSHDRYSMAYNNQEKQKLILGMCVYRLRHRKTQPKNPPQAT